MNAFNYSEAFSRNLGLINLEEQEALRKSTIAIPGLGGVGGAFLMTLTRLGVGGFRIADVDEFSLANFNRQWGAFLSSVGKQKNDVMTSMARDINPELRFKTYNQFIDEKNVEDFLKGCDVLVDSVDAFALPVRRLLFQVARRLKIPVVNAGPVGFSCSMMIFTPESISFDDYFQISDNQSVDEQFIRFIVGLTPDPMYLRYMDMSRVDSGSRQGPSVASAVTLCAGFAATEILKLILKRGRVYSAPYYHYYDPYVMKFVRKRLWGGNRNPLQKIKIALFKRMTAKKRG